MEEKISVKDNYKVSKITYESCKEWLLYKHYAHKIPSIQYSFGIFNNKKILQGICCFGSPANNHNNVLGEYRQIELVRLVINEGLEKNILSYFVSQCFNLLERPVSIISYADQGKNHHGYIYQATNWVYTGLGGGVDYYMDNAGNEIHSRIMSDYRLKFPDMSRDEISSMLGWEKQQGTYKHRYFYFLGSKGEKKLWMKELKSKYEILPYPKGDNVRYDASYAPKMRKKLF